MTKGIDGPHCNVNDDCCTSAPGLYRTILSTSTVCGVPSFDHQQLHTQLQGCKEAQVDCQHAGAKCKVTAIEEEQYPDS